MPMAPRPSGKAAKIAYALLGKPANMTEKLTKKEKEMRKAFVVQETMRVR